MSKLVSGTASLCASGDGINLWQLVLNLAGNAASPFEHLPVTTSNGNTTLTPPSTAVMLVLLPPSSSTVTKTLKGVSGDTGVPLSPNMPTILALPASPGALILTCNGVETVDAYWL